MKASRDREKKRAGRIQPKEEVTDSALARQVGEFCRLLRQQNKELRALLRLRRQALLGMRSTGLLQ